MRMSSDNSTLNVSQIITILLAWFFQNYLSLVTLQSCMVAMQKAISAVACTSAETALRHVPHTD
jgi:hypothetical protein